MLVKRPGGLEGDHDGVSRAVTVFGHDQVGFAGQGDSRS